MLRLDQRLKMQSKVFDICRLLYIIKLCIELVSYFQYPIVPCLAVLAELHQIHALRPYIVHIVLPLEQNQTQSASHGYSFHFNYTTRSPMAFPLDTRSLSDSIRVLSLSLSLCMLQQTQNRKATGGTRFNRSTLTHSPNEHMRLDRKIFQIHIRAHSVHSIR